MVLLSFDIEEFDMPAEYGRHLPFGEQISISVAGTRSILDLLDRQQVKATFFCTATFALNAKELIREMIDRGHEVASHGYYHSSFDIKDLAESRVVLESITGQPVTGYRMARMMPIDELEIAMAGYHYNSSLNPTWIPGRYNNWNKPRKLFRYQGILQLPASVSPLMRIPLFWLSFHNFPMWLYRFLCHRTYRNDGYLNLYFHPWEFTDLAIEKLNMPGFVHKNSGDKMTSRMEHLIDHLKTKGLKFDTIRGFLADKKTVAKAIRKL
ncbi:polysaccharide deacetylase family protein [Hufsiella ginkgonis]|uniref:Polysaccharide deacetylase family protein n=1 Tax=Hufsiella ginkgonis TaxID=2695274 RepID=A0A7K1XWH8_9SPHI|nr:polysaccharide deacetylase family protein [Hufsiella ginkgonis]MXV15167.1 polysaccharide deacetylase family protein [Hufsiella ginkgonis]